MNVTTHPVVPVILCGGTGDRLWPLSSAAHPKQFLTLPGDTHSLLQKTLLRIRSHALCDPIIVTHEAHRFIVAQQLRDIDMHATLLLEPQGRNTAPAITAAGAYIAQRDGDAIMLALPADHIIEDDAAYHNALQLGMYAAQHGYITTFGITPDYAACGYGYIKTGTPRLGEHILAVEHFVEKPDASRAQAYVESGDYVWNSGMFMLPVARTLEEIRHHEPQLSAAVEDAVAQATHAGSHIRLGASFARAPSLSLDCALMERTDHAVAIALSCRWCDVGTWDALWRIAKKDASGNAITGESTAHATRNCHIHAQDGMRIAALGVENLAIIARKGVVMVAHLSHAQQVKALAKEAPPPTQGRIHRRWGFYDVLHRAPGYLVKQMHLYARARLSVQMHNHRDEHWSIISGEATAWVGKKTHHLRANEHINIGRREIHCVENTGDTPLIFIEVQYGDYLEEDDIVRFDDAYLHHKPATQKA